MDLSVTTVPAVHSNGVSGDLIGGKLGDMLDAVGLTAYAGPATGYVLSFSNGLVVYLSGDTGITAEQKSVVRGHYRAELVVMNIGDTFTTGPTEAAYVINDLIKPTAVIAAHVNEAATLDGKVLSNTKTGTFIKATSVPVHLPLSGRTMAFDRGRQLCERVLSSVGDGRLRRPGAIHRTGDRRDRGDRQGDRNSHRIGTEL